MAAMLLGEAVRSGPKADHRTRSVWRPRQFAMFEGDAEVVAGGEQSMILGNTIPAGLSLPACRRAGCAIKNASFHW